MSIHMAALEAQLSGLAIVRLLLSKQDKHPGLKPLATGWEVDQQILERARPFAWSSETTRAVLEASRSIPLDTVMNVQNLEDAASFWWFEEPLPFVTNQSGLGIRALGFARTRYVHRSTGRAEIALPCHTWVDETLSGGRFLIAPSQIWDWENNITLGEMLERTRNHHRINYGDGGRLSQLNNELNAPPMSEEVFMTATAACARFVLAGLAWLRQTILVPEVERVERHRRKAFNRETKQDLDGVRVVRLRRRVYAERAKEEGVENAVEPTREWHCRWIVTGHFRNQPFGPGRAQKKLIYIMPFVKGPDDKPLRTGATVAVVDR